MTRRADLRMRSAGPGDTRGIAALHADSWRRHYRGAYADAFLDGDVDTDRLVVWTAQLAAGDGATRTIVAEDGEGALVGFVHVVFDADPSWGALVENLHVTHTRKRHGVGTSLMAEAGRAVAGQGGKGGLYLWVLEQNTPAQAFYEALGGRRVERADVRPPGGDPARLNGTPAGLRYVWSEPLVLFEAR